MDIIGLASACAGILVAIKQVSVGSFLYLFPISKQISKKISKIINYEKTEKEFKKSESVKNLKRVKQNCHSSINLLSL